MNDKEFITSIRDQCNQYLAGNSDPSPTPTPPANTDVPAITVKPDVFADLGVGYGAPVEKVVAPLEVVGYSLTFREGTTAREVTWSGKPGSIFHKTSWAIFDSGGARVMGQDNYSPAGTLGMKIESPTLMPFAPGTYTLAIAINEPGGNLGVQFNQRP